MKRRIAVVGDELSGGGQILDYTQASGFSFHGHKTALIGNEAYCQKCKSTGTLAKAGGPYRLKYHTTREAALDGDIVLCGCLTPPRIIALLAENSWVDDRDEEYRLRANPLATQLTNPNDAAYAYDQYFLLKNDRTGEPLANMPYSIVTEDGEAIEGRTDSQGRTCKVSGDRVVMATIHIFEEITPLNPDWDQYP